MESLGFSKDVTLLYLSNRQFEVNLNKTFLEIGKRLSGVPQGSI